jgi:hypothetical protein
MKRIVLIWFFAALASGTSAQQLAQDPATSAPDLSNSSTPPENPPDVQCAKDDALCILAQSLKKKDPGTGSKSGTSPGFIANQPPTVPGSRLDLQFLQRNEIKG